MPKLRSPVNEQDHKSGSPNGKITLVEYGDYQCPHCGLAHPLVKRLMKQFSKELLFVFRNFPLQESHPYAMIAALAAEAADKQNKFWEMHDMIYENQLSLNAESLLRFAGLLHLNLKIFGQDANSKEVLLKVETDFESGVRSGVNGTPTFFLDGNKLGNYDESYESLENAVRNAH